MTRKIFTPGRLIISVICVAGIITTFVRFAKGLGAVTNLSDRFPWGLWVGFDVLCGVALAAGGFVMTASVYLLNLRKYQPLLRPTILTAFLGYILVSTGLIYDLGKPYNIWHPLIMWNAHSAMFEVAWCVMLYSTVLALEFSPILFEHLRMERAKRIIHAIEIPVVIAGVVLSTLHQSSLGTLFLIVPDRLHPLWYTPVLPVLFFISAITVGLAMVIVESSLSSKFFHRSLKLDLLIDMGRFLIIALMLYLAVRFQDLIFRGSIKHVFSGGYESAFFAAEIFLMLAPMVALMFKRIIVSRRGLFFCALSVIGGVVLNRLDVAIVGMMRSAGVYYFPSAGEITVSIFLVTVGIIIFALADKYLPLFPMEKEAKETNTMKQAAVILMVLFMVMPLLSYAEPTEKEQSAAVKVRLQKLSIDDRKAAETPEVVIYKTDYKKGALVKFNHKMHAGDYGLKCIECHHVEKCAHCHGQDTTPMMVEESKIALHETCMGCHRAMGVNPRQCDTCHKQ